MIQGNKWSMYFIGSVKVFFYTARSAGQKACVNKQHLSSVIRCLMSQSEQRMNSAAGKVCQREKSLPAVALQKVCQRLSKSVLKSHA